MKTIDSDSKFVRHKYLRWIPLVLAATVVAGLGIEQGVAAPTDKQKPVPTKAGKKAGLQAAAASLLQAPMVNTAVGTTDQTKVPHYFGPYPNWALSPLTTTDAKVVITGDGTGATATAAVDSAGVITGFNIINPGRGYTTASVAITGSGSGASATATLSTTSVVTGITVTAGGAGYTRPTVTIFGGGATTAATATAYGGVDAVGVGTAGSGYTFPTVDFDMSDDPNGAPARAHATVDSTGAITGVVVDEPGSGYRSPPNVVIRDGTLMDPINNGGSGATSTATLTVRSIVLDT